MEGLVLLTAAFGSFNGTISDISNAWWYSDSMPRQVPTALMNACYGEQGNWDCRFSSKMSYTGLLMRRFHSALDILIRITYATLLTV